MTIDLSKIERTDWFRRELATHLPIAGQIMQAASQMRLDSGRTRTDADDVAFVARELVFTKARMYDTIYLETEARRYLPLATDADPGAAVIAYQQWQEAGRAKIVSNKARDLPRVDASLEEAQRVQRTVGAEFSYTVQDLATAAYTRKPLDMKRADAARRAIEVALDDIAATGDADWGIASGAANDATVAANCHVSHVYDWDHADTTAVEIASDIGLLIESFRNRNQRQYEVDSVLLAPSAWAAASARVNEFTGESALDIARKRYPRITLWDSWSKLATAGSGNTPRCMAYARTPAVLEMGLSLDFTMLPPQPRGLEFVVPCYAVTSGCMITVPLAISYMDAVLSAP